MNRSDEGRPAARDFGPIAVRSAIRREALTHPATLYPGVAGVLGGLAWALFGSPIFLGFAFAASIAGLASFTVNYFFRDKTFSGRYVEQLKERMAAQKRELVDSIQEGLRGAGEIPGGEEHAYQGLEQFAGIRQKYDNFNALVEEKFGSGELALGEIWSAMEQVYLGVLENLREVVSLLQSISTIDPEYIRKRLDKLSRMKGKDEADLRETETLLKRQKLRDDQLRKVNELLTRNEEALTQMEEATIAVAGIRSEDPFTAVNTVDSVNRLRELASTIYRKE